MEIVSRDRSVPFVTKDGSEIRSILDRTNSRATHQSLAEATLAPGARTEPHAHPRAEEIYYVLRGTGRMIVGTEERDVGLGDGVLIPPGTRHTIQNIGPDPLVFLCCCAPPYSNEDTVLEPRAENGEPSCEKTGAPRAEKKGEGAPGEPSAANVEHHR